MSRKTYLSDLNEEELDTVSKEMASKYVTDSL